MTVEQDLFRENTAAYVLGELRGAERTAFEAHLDGCEGCAAEVRAMAGVLGALPHGVPLVEPPGGLRQRVLDAAIAAREPSHVIPFAPKTGSAEPRQGTARGAAMAGWLAAAASLAVAVGLGVHSMNLQGRLTLAEDRLVSVEAQLQDSQERLQVSQRETSSTRATLAVLSAPDARDLPTGPLQVNFAAVDFAYDPDREILRNLDFAIAAGKTGSRVPSTTSAM